MLSIQSTPGYSIVYFSFLVNPSLYWNCPEYSLQIIPVLYVTNLQGVTRGHPIYFRFLHHFHLFSSFPRRTTQIRPSRASRASRTSQNCTVNCTVNAQSMRSNAQSMHSHAQLHSQCTVFHSVLRWYSDQTYRALEPYSHTCI